MCMFLGDISSYRDVAEFWISFTTDVFTCLDSERKDEFRQRFIRYSWPDFLII